MDSEVQVEKREQRQGQTEFDCPSNSQERYLTDNFRFTEKFRNSVLSSFTHKSLTQERFRLRQSEAQKIIDFNKVGCKATVAYLQLQLFGIA